MFVDSTEIKYRSELSRRQVEIKIKELIENARQVSPRSWNIPKLSMLVRLNNGDTIDNFIRKYIEDRNEIKGIERRAKIRMKQQTQRSEDNEDTDI